MKRLRRAAAGPAAPPRLFEWGMSGRSRPKLVPELVPLADVQLGSEVTQVRCHSNASFALLRGGSVLYWGGSTELMGFAKNDIAEPIALLSHVKVVSLSPGLNHLSVLSDQGTVHFVGSDALGASGRGGFAAVEADLQKFASTALAVPIPEPVKELASGSYDHGVALGEGGSVYCWGCNADGQCGVLVPDQDISGVRKVTELPGKVKRVFAGPDSSFAQSAAGELFWWGLAPGAKEGHAVAPLPPLPNGEEVTDVKLSTHDMFCLGSKQTVYKFENSAWKEFARNVSMLEVGIGFGAVLSSESDMMLFWGTGDNGRLGDGKNEGHTENLFCPTFFVSRKVKMMALGPRNGVALLSD